MNRWLAADRLKVILPCLLLLGLVLYPATGPSANVVKLIFITALWTTTSLAWNLLGGFTGQVSFGFAVFYGLGAYVTALLINAGRSPWFAFLCAAGIAALASFLVGLPTFRLRGPYFAIATIGVGEAVRVVMNNLDFTGGASGYRLVEAGPFRPMEHYYTAVGLLALAFIVASLVASSKFGLALRAIKQDQDAAAAVGVNPYICKLWVHAIAAALTGIAGGVFARYALFIYPGGVFAFQTSISILLMPVIGGIGTVWGAVLGGVIFGVVEEQLVAKFPNVHLLLYGALLMLIILFEPDGLMGLLRRAARLFRRRREDPGSPNTDEVLWGSGSLEGRKL
ncbi:MAG TPA: branched-chain amino acid ABC transporter permease [Candidatus Angelobacter sp.]